MPGSVTTDLDRVLTSAGLGPTVQRRAVLAELLTCANAGTARQLRARLVGAGHAVGLSTVYRTLNALAAAGVVHTFDRRGEVAFRPCGADTGHEHLICLTCGRVDEVAADATLDRWADARARAAGYTVRSHRTDVYGVCASC